jgi:putative transposase
MSMPEIERLDDAITWIDLSFVKRERTPRWAIYVGIRCHLAGMSLRDTSQFLDELGVSRSHVAIHEWVHKANLQPLSTVTADQLAVDETMIRLHGRAYWLYAVIRTLRVLIGERDASRLVNAVDPRTNEIAHVSHYPTTNKTTTRQFLTELHRRYQLDDVVFLIDGGDHLAPVFDTDGYDYRVVKHGNRNAIERVFWEIQRRTTSFANSFSHVTLQTAERWLQAAAVSHNSRQS